MSTRRFHICPVREVDDMDRRRARIRKGSEAEVLLQVRTYGGFTVFWASEMQRRARTLDDMVRRGLIIVTPRDFPWSDAVAGDTRHVP